MRTAIINGLIVTIDENNRIIKNGTLTIQDDAIDYIGDNIEDLSQFDQVIDAKGKIVMPGLINTHGHTPMTLLRGVSDDLPLQEWLEKKIWPLERQFTEEHIYWGSRLAIVEMIKTGTTTFSDMYIHMDIIAEAVKDTGIRGNLSRGIIGFGGSEEKNKKLLEAADFAKRWNNSADGRITTMMSPHSPYSCDPDFIKEIVQAAEDLNLPIQIHLSETSAEVELSINQFGKRPVELLADIGLFERPSLVAHGVHLLPNEIEILADKDVRVSHNPGSNLKLGSGIAPIPQLIKRNITVSLGTDGAASNNNLDLFDELRLAALIHKGVNQDSTLIDALTAIKMATIKGAKSLFIDHLTGTLAVGKKADLIMLNIDQPHFYPMHDPISHLVYTASGADVTDTFVNGKQLMKDRKLLYMDEERICYEVGKIHFR